MDDEAEEFIPTRKSLLSRLKSWEDNASWREFFDTYWKLIYGVALKAGLTHTEAQDVVQETVLGVAKSISQFKYDPARCAFKSWLMKVTRNRIANEFERRKRQPLRAEAAMDGTSSTPLLERIADPSANDLNAIWNEEWEKNLVDVALRKIKQRVPIQQYQMFDFYVIKKWPVSKVARTLGVTIGHVYVAKHRITRLMKKEVQMLEKKTL
jgi:RNA polymerase sigma-70 factor (ECF subfamily)